jgi:NADH-quinone oxidoreductase subunit K
LYRAFQIAPADQPHLTSHLAMALAQFLMAKGHFLATREYLRLAVLFDPENEDAMKAFIAFARAHGSLAGQVFGFFVMTVAAAEVAVGLALMVTVFKSRHSSSVDSLNSLRG